MRGFRLPSVFVSVVAIVHSIYKDSYDRLVSLKVCKMFELAVSETAPPTVNLESIVGESVESSHAPLLAASTASPLHAYSGGIEKPRRAPSTFWRSGRSITATRFAVGSMIISVLIVGLQFVGGQNAVDDVTYSECLNGVDVTAGRVSFAVYLCTISSVGASLGSIFIVISFVCSVFVSLVMAVMFYLFREIEDNFFIVGEIKLAFCTSFIGNIFAGCVDPIVRHAAFKKIPIARVRAD